MVCSLKSWKIQLQCLGQPIPFRASWGLVIYQRTFEQKACEWSRWRVKYVWQDMSVKHKFLVTFAVFLRTKTVTCAFFHGKNTTHFDHERPGGLELGGFASIRHHRCLAGCCSYLLHTNVGGALGEVGEVGRRFFRCFYLGISAAPSAKVIDISSDLSVCILKSQKRSGRSCVFKNEESTLRAAKSFHDIILSLVHWCHVSTSWLALWSFFEWNRHQQTILI